MPLQERWAFGIFGLGLLIAGGFSEALRHDPADSDVFPFRILARVGFLLTGAGVGLCTATEGAPMDGVWPAGLIIVPVSISLIRLLWTHRKEKS